MRGYGALRKKLKNTTDILYPLFLIFFLTAVWQFVTYFKIVPQFMLPSPYSVLKALISDAPLLLGHAKTTLFEAAAGLALSIAAAFIFAVLMDRFKALYEMLYPICVITQTVPTIAVAPLLVLWMGYGMAPKVAVIFITCFFPILIGLLQGLSSCDAAVLRLYRSMGAGYLQTLFGVKLYYAAESFFSGLKISAAYSLVGAVIAEWLGGSSGLGVYMTRVRKAYSYDKMFAVIFVITVLSLLIVWLVEFIKKRSMPWKKYE